MGLSCVPDFKQGAQIAGIVGYGKPPDFGRND